MKNRFTIDVLAPDYGSKIDTFDPGDVLSASCSWMWHSVGTANLYVREFGIAAAQLMLCRDIPVPITMKTEGFPRWDGYVVYASSEKKTGSVGRITATAVSNRKWIDRVLAAPVPGSPWSNQSAAEYDVRVGPLATVVRGYIQANIDRINASGQTLPLRVTPAPTTDNSPVVNLSARNESVRDVVEATIEANGYDVVSYLWLPGDNQPNGLTLVTPTVVIDVVKAREKDYVNFTDRSGGISNRQVSVSAPQATAVIIGGPGQGTARTFNYVRATAETPQRTQAAQLILDRLNAVVPPVNVAADAILDRINSGADYTASWTWDDIDPLVSRYVADWSAYLVNLFISQGGVPTNRNTSLTWLQNYLNTHGGQPTLPVPDRTKAAQAILQRLSGTSPIFADWTWIGASQEVLDFGPMLARLAGTAVVADEAKGIPWLTNFISSNTGQEFGADWTWVEAPILVGIHKAALVALYNGDTTNWPASRTWLQNYIAANDSAGGNLYPGLYGESFYELTSETVTEVRIAKGREKLAELGGKVGMLIDIEDGFPWKVGPNADFWVGDYVRASFGDVTTADYISRVTATSNVEGFKVTSQLGDPNLVEKTDIKLANIVGQLVREVAALKTKR